MNDIELQLYFIKCIIKNDSITYQNKINIFFKPAMYYGKTPFEYIDSLVEKNHLLPYLTHIKIGNPYKLYNVFKNKLIKKRTEDPRTASFPKTGSSRHQKCSIPKNF